jgi:tyrosine-protein kinase Etk/Wzc
MNHYQAVPQEGGGEEIDLNEIRLILQRHWRRIAWCAGAAAVLAMLYVLFAAPQFAITGSLYLGDARPSAPAGQQESGLNFLSDFQAVSDINTQVELIKSKGLVEQAILESGLNAPVRAVDAPGMPFWKWLIFYGRNVAAFAPQPGDLRAVDATIDDARGPVVFKILVGDNGNYRITKTGNWFAAGQIVLSGQLGQPAAGGGLSLLLKPSVGGIEPAAGRVFVLKVMPAAAVQDILQNGGGFTVLAGGVLANPTKIANLQLLAADPYAGADFVNQLMSDFISSQASWNNQAASATQDFISQQLAGIHESLSTADQKLAAYQAQTGILDVPENAKAVIGQLSQYEVQRTSLQLQQEALQQLAAEIKHPQGRLNPYLLSQAGDSVLGQLTTSLAAEETKLQTLQSQFTADAPDVQAEQASVDEIEASIRSVVGNELATANNNLAALDAVIAQLNTQLSGMPAESLQVISLTRASQVYGQIYVLLMQKEEEAEVSKAASIVDTRVITPADIPLRAAAPKVMVVMAASIMLGLFAGVAFVLVQRALSTRMQSEEDVRRLVRLPVYGVIPRREEAKAAQLMMPHAQSSFAEALRLLRGNIQRSGTQKTSHVLLLSSAGVDDGKTTIAINLAKTLADGGKRVILVDADLHHGRIQEALHCDPSAGLTEWLVTMNRPQIVAAPGQRFMVLAAGVLPPNASELLSEPYLANIIANLRAEFDYVVIDSPPLPAVSDGMILGEQADLILSVVMIGHTSRRVLAMHNELLSGLGRRHGIIINGVIDDAYGYGYGYGYSEPEPLGAVAKFRRLLERA